MKASWSPARIGMIVGGIAVVDGVVVLCDGPLWLAVVLAAALGVAVLVLIGTTSARRGDEP